MLHNITYVMIMSRDESVLDLIENFERSISSNHIHVLKEELGLTEKGFFESGRESTSNDDSNDYC